MSEAVTAASGPQARHVVSDGEQWATEALTALRAARFRPHAVRRFLRESFDRAAQNRARRGALARQARLWSVSGAAAALGVREALVRRGVGAPSGQALVAWCAIDALMLDWHIGMVERADGGARSRLCAADALTLGRSVLAPFAAAAPPDAAPFLLLLVLGGGSDLLDGRLARRAGPTRFGRDFDTLADLAFRAGAIRGAVRAGWLPSGAARALLARQALLTSGAAWHWFAHSRRPPLDAARLARWDAPPLLAGLVLGACGRRTAGGTLVVIAAAVGVAGLARAQLAPRVRR